MGAESLWDVILFILKKYGPVGIGIGLLVSSLVYVYRRSIIDRKEYRLDFGSLNEQHQVDRDDWNKSNERHNIALLDVVKGNSDALQINAVALEKLSIHIENCNRKS